RRVMEFQQRVATLQRDTMERAQSIEMNFQQALVEIQRRDLDPIIEGIIARKNLSLVIDGRFARVGANAPAGLDITDDVINALNRKNSTFRMARPQGF
ncbi:MAG: OmpH family outer membrane protein, partial [Alphaproteobacteria bacterium]|nr:OmpH family outer membrane protein [Alphaproteobacteria bacterium]